jgi:orotate phosphoribosyltransferase
MRELFLNRAVQFGDFTLASGRKSPYYINSKRVLFHSEAISLLGEMIFEVTHDLQFDAIGGLEVGAIPMTAAALTAYHAHGRIIEGFFVRKEAKSHGAKERLEGTIEPGQRVVMVDDVLTTGGSVLQAIAVVEGKGATVVRVISICDRLAGAAEALARYDYRPLYTIHDFGLVPV